MQSIPSAKGAAKGGHALSSRVAIKALLKSVVINMIAPAVIYSVAAPHFAAMSLAPLALSGTPPIIWLAYGIIKLRAIDFLGLFAAENTVVRIAALALAHSEQQALIGRSMENVFLAALFLASLATTKPLVLQMSRQLQTGNDPAKRDAFDAAATRPAALKTYQTLTLGWTFALLIKAAGAYLLAANFATKDYLLLSPLWDLASDSVLVTWSMLYGRSRLRQRPAEDVELISHSGVAP
ncbi:VC0807 family protein [Bradyrhizobium sp. LTSPM299]|uniref:VC0807 family protein n=1 Tax=Bradyrhizobium sp. LTSPM299 TaxID=1619233 RepID=UPI0005CB2703|nr:VC0807 family protein [Bradyrhizobium sp. LTSPM299]